MRLVTLCSLLLGLAAAAHAVPSLVKPVSEAVTVVYDDTGNWGGDMSNHITHQSGSAYRARKILDLSAVPQATWDRTQTVRLSLNLMVHDYSFHYCPQINGLDEAFQVIINGQVHEYPMRAGAPVMAQDSIPNMDWHDLVIPKAELRRGPNEIVIAKAPGKIGQPDARPDDYLYLGIDSSRKRGNSAVAFDGQTWTQERLTVPGGNGEYMVRLYLIAGTASVRAVWRGSAVRVQGSGVRAGSGARRPSAPDRDDPAGILLYAGARGVKPAPEGCRLTAGQSARVEWDPAGFDRLEPLRVSVQVRGPARMQWLDARGEPAREPAIAGLAGTLPAGRTLKPSGVVITAAGEATVQSVTVEGSRGFHQPQPRINMAPAIADPPATQPRRPACRVEPKAVTLAGGFTQAVFERGDHLRLRSLKNLISRSEMLRHPNAVALFLVEVAGRRYAGSRDFRLVGLKAKGNGFEAILEGPATGNRPAAPAGAASRPASTNAPAGAPTAGAASPPAGIHAMAGAPTAGAQFRIVLSISASAEGLRMAMNLINIGRAPADFKLAFPHLSGLAVSEKPEEDYYFYPFGGGIIADAPALIRHGYGDHEALYQVMDLFSPARGCGLSLRTDDTQGWHKILALRKHVPERAVVNDRRTAADQFVRPEYRWGNSLDAEIEGTSFSYEYLRRRRSVGSMGSVGSVGSGAGPHSPYSPYSPHFGIQCGWL